MFYLLSLVTTILLSPYSSGYWDLLDQDKVLSLLDQWIHNGHIGEEEWTKLDEYLQQTQLHMETGLVDEEDEKLLKRIGILFENQFKNKLIVAKSNANIMIGEGVEASDQGFIDWLTVKISELKGFEELVEWICSYETFTGKARFWTQLCGFPNRNFTIENLFGRWINGQDFQQDHLLVAQVLGWLFRRVKNYVDGGTELGLSDLPLLKGFGDKMNDKFREGIVAADRLLKRIHEVPEVAKSINDACSLREQHYHSIRVACLSFWRKTCALEKFHRWIEGYLSMEQKPMDHLAILMDKWGTDENGVPIPEETDRTLLDEVVSNMGRLIIEFTEEEGRLLRTMFTNRKVGDTFEQLCRALRPKMVRTLEYWPSFCTIFDGLNHVQRFVEEMKNPIMSPSKLSELSKRIGQILDAAFSPPKGKSEGLRHKIAKSIGVLEEELGKILPK